MRATRRFRIITVILSLWALLFAQVALAASECKSLGQGSTPMEMQVSPAGEPMHRQHGDDSVCHAHHKTISQQATNPQADNVQPPALPTLADFPPAFTVDVAPTPASLRPAASPQLRRSGSPPISVQNCCFRI
jgi:hypothetical protein